MTFQPPAPPGQSNSATGSAATSTSSRKQSGKSAQPDLITRYNLKDKLNGEAENDTGKGKGWSSNRDERQASLQKRRDEMILAARKKMEAKLAAEAAAKSET